MRVLHEETETLGLVYFFSWQFRFTRAMRMTHDLIARGTLEKTISRKPLDSLSWHPFGVRRLVYGKEAVERWRTDRDRRERARLRLLSYENAASNFSQRLGL